MSCQCGRIVIGTTVTDQRNWNPDCEEHGTKSEWWNSPEQQSKIAEQSKRLRDLQKQAREARSKGKNEAENKLRMDLLRWVQDHLIQRYSDQTVVSHNEGVNELLDIVRPYLNKEITQ